MGIQERDWYQSRLLKRLGYIERAAFRLPARSSQLPAKLKPWRVYIAALSAIFLAILASAVWRFLSH